MSQYTEIVDGVYDVTVRQDDNGRRYRVYLFDGETPTLVDAGFADTAETMFAGIDATGVEPERLVLTHGDTDHVDGYDAAVERYDLETWVPESTDMSDHADPDHRYAHGDRIGRFEAIHVPGHRHDNHALVDEGAGVLVTADALSGADLRGFPEGYLLPHASVFAEDFKEADLNLDRLLEYEWDTALVFHGSSVVGDAYEKLDRYYNFPGRPAEPLR